MRGGGDVEESVGTFQVGGGAISWGGGNDGGGAMMRGGDLVESMGPFQVGGEGGNSLLLCNDSVVPLSPPLSLCVPPLSPHPLCPPPIPVVPPLPPQSPPPPVDEGGL